MLERVRGPDILCSSGGSRPVAWIICQAGVFLPHDHAEWQQNNGRDAPVWGRAERDLDVVPGRQSADHEQAELLAVGEVELWRAGEASVDVVDVVGAQAQTPVLDLSDEADTYPVGPDLDPRIGR